jgi:predicted nucleotidyltransferase
MILEILSRISSILDHHHGIEVYLFGSVLTRKDPADLDVLVIYEDRDGLQRFLDHVDCRSGGLPIDVTAMTSGELASSGFLVRSKAIRIHEFRPPT